MNMLTPRRSPQKMSHDLSELHRLLDSTAIAHVSIIRDGRPFTFGTLAARVDDSLVIHGSTGSRWMNSLLNQPCSVAVTKVDGIIAARSAFESSMLYRSALILGQFERVPEERKDQIISILTDRLIPGRSEEVRPSQKKELAATLLLAIPLDEWSLRVSDGWPEDTPEDIEGDAWGGRIRFTEVTSVIEPAPDLRPGIEPTQSILKAQRNASTVF